MQNRPLCFDNLRRGGFRSKWTPELIKIARAMREDGRELREIAKAVGLSTVAVSEKVRDISERLRLSLRAGPVKPHDYVPAEVMAELERRSVAIAQQDDIAQIFGDPPPGYSALDQKRMAGA